MLLSLLVKLAYFISSFDLYLKVKEHCNKLLNKEGKAKNIFDFLMIILVLSTIFLLIYEVEHQLEVWMINYQYGALSIFIIEYLGRIWTASDNHRIIIDEYEYKALINQPLQLRHLVMKLLKKKLDYMTTPLAIIDLLAILPSYRPLRVLRIFLLFRLFKLFRYTRSINAFFNVLSQKKFELYTLTIFLGFVVFASSAAIYIFEVNKNTQIVNFFDALYWSLVTVTTVGYGDITPQSLEGRLITITLILSGLGVISFATSIIVSAFNEKLEELKEHRVLAEVEKLSEQTIICGFGRIGQVVAKKHRLNGNDYIILDKDPEMVELAKKWGYRALVADATSSTTLLDLDITSPGVKLVAATKSDEMNIFITITARSLSQHVTIISRVNSVKNKEKFVRAGASEVIAPYEIVGMTAIEHLGGSVAPKALEAIISGESGIHLEPLKVTKEMLFCNKRVGQINSAEYRIVIFGIMSRDGGFIFNPSDTITIEEGDVILLFGRMESIERIKLEEINDQDIHS